MGIVYEVEHVRLRKRYVAKVIHEQIRGDETAPKRMEREAQVLADINHPNVVQVHDVGVTPDGTSYFVMEKLEGHDLRRAMKEGMLSTSRAVGIAVDMLDALEHVHRRGIVHRDIKPENIFLATMPTGVVTKVLDFGIVHIFDGERVSQARITKTGGFVGTLYYAAPEQMQGQSAGPPNDVYATGLVLFEMLVGRGPFDDDPGVGLSRCFKPAPRLPTSERIPPALADAVASALEQDPAKRPAAGALASRLRQALSTLTTDPGPVADNPRGTVENLLVNLDVGGPRSPSVSVAHTAAPATPPMAGAPPRTPYGASVAHAPTQASAVPASALAFGATVASPGPNVDTSSGVASSIEPFHARKARPSLAVMIGAPIAAVAVLALIAVGGISALRRTPANTAAAAAVSAAPPEPAPPVVTATASERAIETAPPPQAEPAPAPAPAPAPPPVASTSAPKSPTPVPPPPAAAKPRGNAEKDGYMKAKDL
jgi:serine/threonine-protein kinase